MTKYGSFQLIRQWYNHLGFVPAILLASLVPLGLAGIFTLAAFAAQPALMLEPEEMPRGGAVVALETASGGKAVRFGPAGTGGAPSAGTGSGTGSSPAPASDPAALIFKGDFETGNVHQWDGCQHEFSTDECSEYDGSGHTMQLVESPRRQGKYAARFEVRDGEGTNWSGERSEVVLGEERTMAKPGDDTWYQWSTQFGANFPEAGWGAVTSQWHDDSNNSPPLSFDVGEGRWVLAQDGADEIWGVPLKEQVWHDIKLHIKWSRGGDGSIELWHNGVQQTFTGRCAGTTKCMGKNLGIGGHYFKQGYYRSDQTSETGVIYHDGFSVARSEAGLLPLN